MQFLISWALGHGLFGITPPKPLKSLLIQAENDDGDISEMRDGIFMGLELSADARKQAGENIIVARDDQCSGLVFLHETVRPLLLEHKPDLLCIDPALSFLGGDTNSQKDVGGFLRNGLNPLLREFNCGCVIVHHTNKPPMGREKPGWGGGDFAYLGSGSAEWANHARAVLALRSVGSHEVFELQAAKRGVRLRWKEQDGVTPSYTKLIAHSKQPGVICWGAADEEDLPPPATKRQPTMEDLLAHVPHEGKIPKEILRNKANGAGIALNKINPLINQAVEAGRICEWKEKRSGTNPRKSYSRSPQPSTTSPDLDTHAET
jgi:hypothetical protein